MNIVVLVSFVGALISVLSWIGWRYFVAEGPTPNERYCRFIADRGGEHVAPAPTRQIVSPKRPLRQCSLAVLALLIAGIVVGGVFLFSSSITPDALSVREMDRQAHIQVALNPEHLVPPPALPPSMFVGSERPALESADRDWAKLSATFSRPILRVLMCLQDRGYSFALLEGYRSPERQDMLAAMGTQVTNARAYQSKHQFGLAVDLAPMRDGKLVISEKDPWAMDAYNALGEEASRAGLVWGGAWSLKDYGHVEMNSVQVDRVRMER